MQSASSILIVLPFAHSHQHLLWTRLANLACLSVALYDPASRLVSHLSTFYIRLFLPISHVSCGRSQRTRTFYFPLFHKLIASSLCQVFSIHAFELYTLSYSLSSSISRDG
jgi:hypothetical protein